MIDTCIHNLRPDTCSECKIESLHQRLIAAEVQASVVKEEIEYLIKEAHLWHQKPRLNRIHQAINNSPSPRTHEAFTAMMKALERVVETDDLARSELARMGITSDESITNICRSAIQLAKEVAG